MPEDLGSFVMLEKKCMMVCPILPRITNYCKAHDFTQQNITPQLYQNVHFEYKMSVIVQIDRFTDPSLAQMCLES